MKFHSTICAIAVAVLLLAPACGGGDSYSWCENLDEPVGAVWDDIYRWDSLSHASDWVLAYYAGQLENLEIAQPDEPLSDSELESLAEALDEATNEGRRFEGREAVRAWEDSLRSRC